MAPRLDAAMKPHDGGMRIGGKLGLATAGRPFPFVCFGFLSLFVIVGVSVAWFVPGGRRHTGSRHRVADGEGSPRGHVRQADRSRDLTQG